MLTPLYENLKNSDTFINLTGADPGFPEGGGTDSLGGAPTYDFVRGGVPGAPPLNPLPKLSTYLKVLFITRIFKSFSNCNSRIADRTVRGRNKKSESYLFITHFYRVRRL